MGGMASDVRDLGSAFARGSIVHRSCLQRVCRDGRDSSTNVANSNATTLWGIAGGTSPGDMRSILPEALAHRIWPAKARHMTTIRAEVTRWLNELSASSHAP